MEPTDGIGVGIRALRLAAGIFVMDVVLAACPMGSHYSSNSPPLPSLTMAFLPSPIRRRTRIQEDPFQ